LSENFFNQVEDRIRLVEERMRINPEDSHPDLQSVLMYLLSSGGKRIRPTITLLAGEMLGTEDEKLLNLAAAVELLHTATLVHDDLIDGSMLRRGIPTLNTRWSSAATVLAGDYIFARAATFAAATNSVELQTIFANTLSTIVGGEINQLFKDRGEISRENYYKKIYAKTASLFEACTQCASIISPVKEDVIQKMKIFGYEIGMAFQIVDDILDFTGVQTTVGKPVASDLRQGLITLPTIYFSESYPDDPVISSILEGQVSEDEMDRLIDRIRQSGAIQSAMEEARVFVTRGIQEIKYLPDNKQHDALVELAHYIVDREI
jgi:geranylgeranyl pyrophosphate synthase